MGVETVNPNVPQAMVRLMLAMEDTYTCVSREFGLTSPQARLLCVAGRRPAAVGDIACALRCDRSNVTRLVDRIESRGLVRRRGAESDGRVTLVELSDAGRQLVERFEAILETRLRSLVAGWPEARRREATELLEELTAALEGTPAPALTA